MNSYASILIKLVSTATILTMVASCGGSGNSSNNSSSNGGAGVAGSSLSISGTGLTGAAIVDGAVTVKCKSGNGSAVTKNDGSFALSVANGEKPCLLQIKDPISNTLMHSLLESESVTNVANISPVTDLVVANTLGQTPSVAFNQFDSTIQTKLTAQNVSTAVQVVKAATASLGSDVDMSSLDILKGSIRARQGDVPGDPADKKIDALMSALASSDKKISELSDQIKTASTTSAASVFTSVLGDAVVSLSGCPSARSGDIWTVDFKGGTPIPWKLNFSTNKIKNLITNAESSIVATQKDNAVVKCGFEANIDVGSGAELIKFRVSDGIVASWSNSTSKNFGLSVPKQISRKADANDFGGTFPALFFVNKDSSTRTTGILKYTIDDAGISVNYCQLSETTPNCSGTVPGASVKQICAYESMGYMSCHSDDNKILSKAVMYVNGGQAIMLWSISKFPITSTSGGCSTSDINGVGGTCSSSSTTYDGYGLIVMSKENMDQMPPIGTPSKTGSYIQYKSDQSFVAADNSTFGEVTKTDALKNYFETKISGFTGVFKNYINSPTTGFRFSVYGNYLTVYLGSPSGWLLSTSRSTNSEAADWLIGIRDPQ